jgi:DNA repair exonuclease SbcCD ATPase subunit
MNLFDESLETKPKETSKKINKVTIQNYRNIDYKEYVLSGGDILLEGKNGIGKTNVLEAIYWAISGLLFDGTAKSESQELKPYESAKDVVTSVKIDFENNAFSFERKIEQKWSKDGETYKGFDTKLVVNGAATKNQATAITSLLTNLGINEVQNLFKQVPALAKINLFELLYNTNALRVMDYKDTRAIITNMVGEVDFKEIINENPTKYERLVDPLKSHGLDLQALKTNTRSKIFDKNTGFNKQVSDIKANIKAFDEKSKVTVDKDELANAKVDLDKINNEITELKTKKNTSSTELAQKNSNEITKKQNEIYERKDTLRNEHQEKLNNIQKSSTNSELSEKKLSLSGLKEDRIALNEKISDKNNEKSILNSQVTTKNRELTDAKERLVELKIEWGQLRNPENTNTIYTCPKCNEEFDIALTKEFKESLQPKIDKNNLNGKENTQIRNGLIEGIKTLGIDIDVINESILKLQTERNQLDKNIESLGKDISVLESKANTEKETLPVLDLENDIKILELQEDIKTLNSLKETIDSDRETYVGTIDTKIFELESRKPPLNEIIDLESSVRNYERDTKEARENLSKVNKLLQIQEDISTLIKELEKAMYSKLDKKVGNVFGTDFKFKLWKLNVSNGEYDTRLCEVYGKDDKGRFINMTKINTGMYFIRAIEFIGKIKEFYKIPKSFVFVDELSLLDEGNRLIMKSYGEQIFATQVGKGNTVQEIKF